MATKYQWFLFIAAMVVVTNSEEGACRSGCSTCNCHFNNVEILDHLIETKITSALTGWYGKLDCSYMYTMQLLQ